VQTVLVTGATGFIGHALCAALRGAGATLRIVTRNANGTVPAGGGAIIRGDFRDAGDWQPALQGVDCVVHLAARTHIARDTAPDPLAEYRRVNVEVTRNLAQAAIDCGVRRMVFLSSIKVNGEATAGAAYSEQDAPQPQDAYGRSKWEAEQALAGIAAASKLETVILRPPLVYGPGVKGNFLRLMRTIARGLPLPLGAIDNKRSLIYLGNLVDAIVLGVSHPAAAGNTYLLADDAVSTPELVRRMAAALGKPARLVTIPRGLLKLAGAVAGKTDAVARLTGSLEINSSKIRRELGWQPRCAMPQGLRETAEWYYRSLDTPGP
jgi:nucleoside-diphosphate-sugar epimerase